MIAAWLGTTWTQAGLVVLSTAAILTGVIVYTRIVGLRSFSKMSSFDFAITIAVGAIMGSVGVTSTSLLNGLVGIATLYVLQMLIAIGRRAGFDRVVDNQPTVLMAGERLLRHNLRRARVTEDDVRAKLREANALNLASVRAVVLETTGDISVLHGDDELDLAILDGVRDADALEQGAADDGVRETGG